MASLRWRQCKGWQIAFIGLSMAHWACAVTETGIVTMYGGPADGADPNTATGGLSSGSCGYGMLQQTQWPYWQAAAIGPSNPLATGGNTGGCGACVQITCTSGCNQAGTAAVLITDSCAECAATQLNINALTFEKSFQSNLAQGQIGVTWQQVDCAPPDNIEIVMTNSRTNLGGYFVITLQQVGGTGTITGVSIQSSGSTTWTPMTNFFGVAYQISNFGSPPFSVQIQGQGQTLVATNAISAVADGTYPTTVQFGGSKGPSGSTTATASPPTSLPASVSGPPPAALPATPPAKAAPAQPPAPPPAKASPLPGSPPPAATKGPAPVSSPPPAAKAPPPATPLPEAGPPPPAAVIAAVIGSSAVPPPSLSPGNTSNQVIYINPYPPPAAVVSPPADTKPSPSAAPPNVQPSPVPLLTNSPQAAAAVNPTAFNEADLPPLQEVSDSSALSPANASHSTASSAAPAPAPLQVTPIESSQPPSPGPTIIAPAPSILAGEAPMPQQIAGIHSIAPAFPLSDLVSGNAPLLVPQPQPALGQSPSTAPAPAPGGFPIPAPAPASAVAPAPSNMSQAVAPAAAPQAKMQAAVPAPGPSNASAPAAPAPSNSSQGPAPGPSLQAAASPANASAPSANASAPGGSFAPGEMGLTLQTTLSGDNVNAANSIVNPAIQVTAGRRRK